MVSANAILSKPNQAQWKSDNLFSHFAELCSVRGHPDLAHVPPMSAFPKTHWFLISDGTRTIWNSGNLACGVQMLALKLDREWPEWATNSTNVLGLILSDLLTEFIPWLENIPANKSSFTTAIRFERLLFEEAQLRHTWEWWRQNCKSKPNACFRPSLVGGKTERIVCAGHPIQSKSRRTYSWRAYRDLVAGRSRSGATAEKVTSDNWVLV
ncbi:hypothetical protein BDV93DRAFT_564183 [Ceratobasidium sp. AG-I]|nr:hypothetical protein BDV93DRAFT_564183 [Ceratobasidium sp. AG-I]